MMYHYYMNQFTYFKKSVLNYSTDVKNINNMLIEFEETKENPINDNPYVDSNLPNVVSNLYHNSSFYMTNPKNNKKIIFDLTNNKGIYKCCPDDFTQEVNQPCKLFRTVGEFLCYENNNSRWIEYKNKISNYSQNREIIDDFRNGVKDILNPVLNENPTGSTELPITAELKIRKNDDSYSFDNRYLKKVKKK